MIRSLLKDSSIYSLGDFIFRIVAFATFPIYAHVFSVEEFGLMALILSLVGLMTSITSVGMNNSVQRYYFEPGTQPEDRIKIVSNGLWILTGWVFVVIAILSMLLYSQKDFLFQRFDLTWPLIILGLAAVIPGQILDYAQGILRLKFAPWKFTFVSGCRNAFGVGLGLYLILVLDWGVEGVFWGNLIAMLLPLPLCLWFIRQDLGWGFDKKWCWELFRFGYPFMFAGLAYWIFGLSDRWMLGWLADNTQVGLYSIGFKLATILLFINQAFGMAWSPMAYKLYGENPDYRRIFGQVLSFLMFGMVVVAVGVTLFSPEILALLAPPEYGESSLFVGYLVMGLVFLGTTQITATGIAFEKRTHLISKASWYAAILNVTLNLVMIPTLGAKGAAIATFVSYIFLTGYYLSWTQRIHPFVLERKKILLSLTVIICTLVFSSNWIMPEWSTSMFVFKLCFFSLVIAAGVVFKIFIPLQEKNQKIEMEPIGPSIREGV